MSKRAFTIVVIVIIALAAVIISMHRGGNSMIKALHGIHGR